ncbi:MAG: metalloprotease [Euryarchaeota archaeon]|nr:metalloprotease [Euryarchaeota archaeon]MED5398472.1 site-2 protease family protein [Candidatus Thermoplasmatota archaeon]|tara:strand:- start:1235 stop:2080 length:846 start_codon:yes stop_codon:yes gene_type:complete
MSGERDPRAWRIDDDPFDKRTRPRSHSAARDDGTRRGTRVHFVQVGQDGRVSSSVFGEQHSHEPISIHRGSIWHFSKTEIEHLALATGAFTLALALMFSDGIWGLDAKKFPLYCVLSLITLAPAFLLHEFAHKFVARYYGCWAEFRADPSGLRFGVILAAIAGIVFMAPGAVMVAGNTTRSQFGKIAVAGPLTNVALWSIGFVALFVIGGVSRFSNGNQLLIDDIIAIWLTGNALLAAFNMIPFGPLDGKKIKTWSEPIFYTCLSMTVGIAYYTMTNFSLF